MSAQADDAPAFESAALGQTSGDSGGGIVLPYKGVLPRIAPGVFVAPGAAVIGDVEIAEGASIWFQCVLRGDVAAIRVGPNSNLQDATVVHVSRRDGGSTDIGADVTVGHKALIHACILEDRAFIGMGATVMDGSVVESEAMVAAGALVTPGKRVPARQLWAGRPAQYKRGLTAEEIEFNFQTAKHYRGLADDYRAALGFAPASAGSEIA